MSYTGIEFFKLLSGQPAYSFAVLASRRGNSFWISLGNVKRHKILSSSNCTQRKACAPAASVAGGCFAVATASRRLAMALRGLTVMGSTLGFVWRSCRALSRTPRCGCRPHVGRQQRKTAQAIARLMKAPVEFAHGNDSMNDASVPITTIPGPGAIDRWRP